MAKAKIDIKLWQLMEAVKADLNCYWNTYRLPLSYRRALNKYAPRAKSLGMGMTELVSKLEELNVLQVVPSPTNQRYVIPVRKVRYKKEEFDEALETVLDMEHVKGATL